MSNERVVVGAGLGFYGQIFFRYSMMIIALVSAMSAPFPLPFSDELAPEFDRRQVPFCAH